MDVAERLCRADEVCSGRGQRLTPLRRQVLALIAASEAPVEKDDAPSVVKGLNAAISSVLVNMVRWTFARI